MYSLTNKQLLRLNKEKCKVPRLGKFNKEQQYFVRNKGKQMKFQETDLEKGLGMHIDPNLDFENTLKPLLKRPPMFITKY